MTIITNNVFKNKTKISSKKYSKDDKSIKSTFLKFQAVSELIGTSVSTINRLIKKGRFPSKNIMFLKRNYFNAK